MILSIFFFNYYFLVRGGSTNPKFEEITLAFLFWAENYTPSLTLREGISLDW